MAPAGNGTPEPSAATPGLVWGWPVGPPVPWFAGLPALYMHASAAGRRRDDCMDYYTRHDIVTQFDLQFVHVIQYVGTE